MRLSDGAWVKPYIQSPVLPKKENMDMADMQLKIILSFIVKFFIAHLF